jgi:hypothetical protein
MPSKRFDVADVDGQFIALIHHERNGRRMRYSHSGTIRSLIPVVCTWLIAFLPGDAPGQAIRGRLVDSAMRTAISEAEVVLLGRSGEWIHRAHTDTAGLFELRPFATGRYRIRVTRIGYTQVTTAPVDIRDGETLDVELAILPEAVPLAPLTVLSNRPSLVLDPYLERRGYYERMRSYGKGGFGRFIDREELDRLGTIQLRHVLHGIGAIRVVSTGGRGIQITGRRGCPVVIYINGVRFGNVNIDEMVPVSSVLAIEVYSGTVKPVEFGGCAAVAVWTGRTR